MAPRSPLDDPGIASFAWARYRRIMRWMGLVTVLIVLGIVGFFFARYGWVSIHLYIALALGVGFTIMLMAALMGLVFLSSGTGHDDAVVDPEEEERNRDR